MAKPTIPNIEAIIGIGINPKTGLPFKCDVNEIKGNIKKLLRIKDEQDAVNRYKWYNLPLDISSQEVERFLYYRGNLIFFYVEPLKKFYLMPFALDGEIDFYGRYKRVHPIPFYQGAKEDTRSVVLSTLKLDVIRDVVLDKESIDRNAVCVELYDYSKQMSQTNIPRSILQDGIIDIEADIIPFMRTALISSTGTRAVRIESQDEQSNVTAMSRMLYEKALCGEKYVAVLGHTEFQDLVDGNVAKSEEFMMAMQSLDNFRLSLYGLENGGIYEKKAHMLQSEADVNASKASALIDGLEIRQHFCDIVNSIWPSLGVSVEIAQPMDDSSMEEQDEEQEGQPGSEGDEEEYGME